MKTTCKYNIKLMIKNCLTKNYSLLLYFEIVYISYVEKIIIKKNYTYMLYA
jgi:hypothetical protein